MGVLNSIELAQLMRTAHALVHAAWNEPCSNTIVEAMACGLPVVYRDSGGSAELVDHRGVPLAADLEESVACLIDNHGALSERLHADRQRFLIARAAREYIGAFEEASEGRR